MSDQAGGAGPTLRECRAAARAVRAAEHGREVDRWVRPRGVAGRWRSRPPLALVLRAAAAQDLLEWEGPDGFAVIAPPADRRVSPGRSAAARLFGVLDRWWDVLVFLTVPAAALLTAFGLALAGAGPLVVLLLVLVALLWTAVGLMVGAARGAVGLSRFLERPPEESADLAGSVLARHWTVTLLHARPPEAVRILDAACLRIEDLVAEDVPPVPAADLLCPDQAVTTTDARVEVHTLGDVTELAGPRPVVVTTIRVPLARRTVPDEPLPPSARGIGAVVLGFVAVLALVPALVAGSERSACGDECADNPTTYPSALRWLLGWLWPLGADGGQRAESWPAIAFGLLAVVVSLVTLWCCQQAVVRAATRWRASLERAAAGVAAGRPEGTAPARPPWPALPDRPPGVPVADVFITYRDRDGAWAGLIDEVLGGRLGRDRVFLDHRSISPGQDYADALVTGVRGCQVLLVLVSAGWTELTGDGGGRLLDDPRDWVRREIAEALAARVTVIPLLLDGASRLSADRLPAAIRALAGRQDVALRHRERDEGLAGLAEKVDRAIGPARPPGDGPTRSRIDTFLAAHLTPRQQSGGGRQDLLDVVAAIVGPDEELAAVVPCRLARGSRGPAALVVTDRCVRVAVLASPSRVAEVLDVAIDDLSSVDVRRATRLSELTLHPPGVPIHLAGLPRHQADRVAEVLGRPEPDRLSPG